MRVHRLKELREAIAAVEAGSRRRGGGQFPRGQSPLLSPGVHEWFLDGGDSPSRWIPPLGVMLHVVREFLGNSAGPAFWIGRRCWPHFTVIDGPLLRRCVFIDPPDDASRLWAIDLAARYPGAGAGAGAGVVVVADGSKLDMAASRRLQLACEAGESLVLCARPAAERARLSAASARWLVRSAPSADGSPRWTVELLRFKGKEWTDAQRGVVVHAALVGGPGPAIIAAGGCPA